MVKPQTVEPGAREGDGYSIDASRAPEIMIVSTYGALNRDRFQAMLSHLAMSMDETVGPGRAFCPVVFDMSCSRIGTDMDLPAFRQAEKPLLRRYRQVAFVISDVTQTDLFTFLIAVFAALAPQIQRAENIEQAIQMVTNATHDASLQRHWSEA